MKKWTITKFRDDEVDTYEVEAETREQAIEEVLEYEEILIEEK